MKKLVLITILTTSFLSYAQNRVAAWSNFNPATASYPLLATATNGNVTAGNLNFSNCALENDSRTFIRPNITSASFNSVTSPYVEFNLTLNGPVDFDRFVLPGIASFSTAFTVSLRWSVDNYNTNLGVFTLNSGADYTLTSVDLDALDTVPAGNVTFRIYFYNGVSATNIYAFVNGMTYTSPDNTPSFYVSNGNILAFQIFANTLLSSATFEDNTTFKVFPNPSNGIFTIESDTNTTIEVIDLIGKQILIQNGTIGSSELNLSHVNAGTYFVKVTNENFQTKTIKLIKQ